MKIDDFAGPSITDIERKLVNDVMKNGWQGKHKYHYVELFEREFAKYIGRRYALLTPNATSAIYLALKAKGIGPGDKVVVPELTWCASAFPVSELGAEPIFCDVDKENWCMNWIKARWQNRMSKEVHAAIVVNLYGNVPDYTPYMESNDEFDFVIEDAAESLGSSRDGKKSGTFGDASVFSFHRTKTLTMGEGGCLLTDDEELYNKCLMLRDLGRNANTPEYFNEEISLKFMPTNLQAALGYAQFLRINELIGRKRDQFYGYKYSISKRVPDLQFNVSDEEPEKVDAKSFFNSYWATNIVLGETWKITAQDVITAMEKKGIPIRPMFYPLSMIPAYKNEKSIEYRRENKNAYSIYKRGFNLPCSLQMPIAQLQYVCVELIKYLLSVR